VHDAGPRAAQVDEARRFLGAGHDHGRARGESDRAGAIGQRQAGARQVAERCVLGQQGLQRGIGKFATCHMRDIG